jgi:CHAD domain-containing protein
MPRHRPETRSAEPLEVLFASLDRERRTYLKRVARCRKGMSKHSVHKLRVESRRLLSTLYVLRPIVQSADIDTVRKAVKGRLRSLARLRDTHVQLTAVEKLERRFEELAGLGRRLEKRAHRLEKDAGKDLNRERRVEERALRDAWQAIGRSADAMAGDTAWQAVLAGFDEAIADVEHRFAAIDAGSPETIHRARIAFKQLRYAAETLAPVLPVLTKRRLDRLRRLQARMGRIQDAAVLRATVFEYLAKRARRQPLTTGDGLRSLLDRRLAALTASFVKSTEPLRRHVGLRVLLGLQSPD